MAVQLVRYRDQPELWAQIKGLTDQVWPEYNTHGDELNKYWAQLYDVFPEYQFVLQDTDSGEVLAEGHTIPVAWDGTDDGLGPGIDAAIAGGFALRANGGQPTAVCALAAEIPPCNQRRRLSGTLLEGMAGLAREAGLGWLIAPVRPNAKERYPTIPIERYACWVRGDGTPFDPWIRVHTRMGARTGPALPRSMHITGSVTDWESWTQLRFPDTGDYVFPAGLATVHIDREAGTGDYWEPNLWLIHEVKPEQ